MSLTHFEISYCVQLMYARYLQKNFVRVIENLDRLEKLDTLNLANNSVTTISGLSK